jgi:hypothetical protein
MNMQSTFDLLSTLLLERERERERLKISIYKHIRQHMLQTRILVAYFIPTIKYTNSSVIKTFDFRIMDGWTCMWNQQRYRISEFGRRAYNPFSNIWEPVCLKKAYSKMCVLSIFTPTNIYGVKLKMGIWIHINPHMKYQLLLHDSNRTWNGPTAFSKILQ